ncbi:MAG: S-layer homology domain-containing protein, partial [Clostridia bacterium]|nr:S-layer homology domain-containing protein [Clostridia bacterium]
MKNLKKLISVIIAVIMIVGSFATVSAADYKDVDSTNSFAKAINVLSGLGIVNGDDEGNFNPKNDIKRSEMVALVCRMMGEEDIATNSASNAFTDVAANHWAAGNIAWGVNRGIINGMGDGTFAPDASVSYQDAVVMIMRALGYDRIAQRAQNGGYPAGYLKLASQRGVLKDAGYDNQAAAPREVVAQLIYNAMTAPLVDVKQYGMNVEDDRYIIHDGSDTDAPLRTLLTYTNEIYKVKADITDTAKTNAGLIDKDGSYKVTMTVTNGFGYSMREVSDALTGTETSSAFPITLYVGETDAADLLGATVEAYIAEDEDLNALVLLAVVADAKSVKSETVKAAEVDFTGYTAGSFKYEDADGQEEEIELATGANLTIYYNGKIVGTANQFGTYSGDPATLVPGSDVAAIDNLLMAAEEITFTGSRTSDYDKIFVTDYSYHKVNKVYAEDLYINASGLDLELDPEVRGNRKFTYGLFDGNGAEIEVADIAEDDILNIVAPLAIDKTTGAVSGTLEAASTAYMDIYVTNNVVTGAVEEDFLDGRYTVGGNVYKMVSGTLPSGAEGEFYVTIDGRILAYDASANLAKDFGFIVRAYSEGKYDNTVYENTIRLFTKEGKLVNFLVADRLTV